IGRAVDTFGLGALDGRRKQRSHERLLRSARRIAADGGDELVRHPRPTAVFLECLVQEATELHAIDQPRRRSAAEQYVVPVIGEVVGVAGGGEQPPPGARWFGGGGSGKDFLALAGGGVCPHETQPPPPQEGRVVGARRGGDGVLAPLGAHHSI